MARKTIFNSNLYTLEPDFYPVLWQDDSRMGVLLAEFRPKTVNPENYETKMKFWQEMIQAYCDYTGSPIVCINDLKEAFRRKGTAPYCLQEVFDAMMSQGELQDKDSFMEVPEKSWVGWGINSFVKKPAKWGFGMLKEKLVVTQNKEEISFVVKSAVKRHSMIIQSYVKKCHSFNNIISHEDLVKSLVDAGLTGEGISLALHHLNCTEKVYIEKPNPSEDEKHPHHKILLKFSEPHQTVTAITQMERSIYNLEHTEKFLISVLDEKEQAINNLLTQIKQCLKDGKKQVAKTYLRKKHLLEKDLQKHSQILENVQAMMQRVHGAKSDKDIVNTYKMGSDAIKTAFAECGMNLDNVDDVIEEMKEVLEEQQEIQTLISEPVRNVNDVDESELEKELQELLVDDDRNNAGNNSFTPTKKDEPRDKDKDVFNDDEIEKRLQRLRSDFTDIDTSVRTPHTQTQKI